MLQFNIVYVCIRKPKHHVWIYERIFMQSCFAWLNSKKSAVYARVWHLFVSKTPYLALYTAYVGIPLQTSCNEVG